MRGKSPVSLLAPLSPLCRLDEQRGAIPTRTMHFEKHWRLLESMKAQYVAGNGFRKVSCVVSVYRLVLRVTEVAGSVRSSQCKHSVIKLLFITSM